MQLGVKKRQETCFSKIADWSICFDEMNYFKVHFITFCLPEYANYIDFKAEG